MVTATKKHGIKVSELFKSRPYGIRVSTLITGLAEMQRWAKL